MESWDAGDYEMSGQSLGDIPHILFDLCTSRTNSVSITPLDVAHFLDGFLSAALDSEVGEVEGCLSGADELIEDIETLINDLSKKFNLSKLISDLGPLLVQITDSIRDCGEFTYDVGQILIHWTETITSPIKVAKLVFFTLTKYQKRVKSDATGFVDQWNNGEYRNSGELLGDIPYVVFTLAPGRTPAGGLVQSFVKPN